MLPRDRRVTTELFKETLKKGRSFSSKGLHLKVIEVEGKTKISFSVPKSVEKAATKSNKLKKSGLKALKTIIDEVKDGYVVIVFLKKSQEFPETGEFKSLLEESGLIEKETQEE